MTTRDFPLHILQHALGLDDCGRGKAYRTHYATWPVSDAWEPCMAHVAAGRMTRGEPDAHGLVTFRVTEAGKQYVYTHSPLPPKEKCSEQDYRTWLRAESGLTLGKWLKHKRALGAVEVV